MQKEVKGTNYYLQHQPLGVWWCYSLWEVAAGMPSQGVTGRSLWLWYYYVCRISVEMWNYLCPCISQVAMCKAHNLSTFRHTRNRNLFLWKILSFQSVFIQLSPELGMRGVYDSHISKKTGLDVSSLLKWLLQQGACCAGQCKWENGCPPTSAHSLSFSSCKSPATPQLRLWNQLWKNNYWLRMR